MSVAEKTERLRQERNAKFAVRVFRCRYCPIKVDEKTREGHLGRCAEATKRGVTFSRGMPLDEHFEEVLNV